MSTLGPTAPTQAVSDGVVGTIAFADPLNVLDADDTRATALMLLGQQSEGLRAFGFQFAVPLDATVLGLTVAIERRGTVLSAVEDAVVRLCKAGSPVGDNKAAAGTWPSSEATATYGGPTDLWGTTWTPAEINTEGFGVLVSVSALLGVTAGIDHLHITIDYQGSNRPAFLQPRFIADVDVSVTG